MPASRFFLFLICEFYATTNPKHPQLPTQYLRMHSLRTLYAHLTHPMHPAHIRSHAYTINHTHTRAHKYKFRVFHAHNYYSRALRSLEKKERPSISLRETLYGMGRRGLECGAESGQMRAIARGIAGRREAEQRAEGAERIHR